MSGTHEPLPVKRLTVSSVACLIGGAFLIACKSASPTWANLTSIGSEPTDMSKLDAGVLSRSVDATTLRFITTINGTDFYAATSPRKADSACLVMFDVETSAVCGAGPVIGVTTSDGQFALSPIKPSDDYLESNEGSWHEVGDWLWERQP